MVGFLGVQLRLEFFSMTESVRDDLIHLSITEENKKLVLAH